MNEQDNKLDQLIKQYQSIAPTSEQSLKWYLAIHEKNQAKRSFYRQSLSLAAGLIIGVIISAFFLKMNQKQPPEDFSATLTMVSVKYVAEN